MSDPHIHTYIIQQHTCAHGHAHMHAQIPTHGYTHKHIYTYRHSHSSICTHVCKCTDIHLCISTGMDTSMHTNTHHPPHAHPCVRTLISIHGLKILMWFIFQLDPLCYKYYIALQCLDIRINVLKLTVGIIISFIDKEGKNGWEMNTLSIAWTSTMRL